MHYTVPSAFYEIMQWYQLLIILHLFFSALSHRFKANQQNFPCCYQCMFTHLTGFIRHLGETNPQNEGGVKVDIIRGEAVLFASVPCDATK